RGGGRELHGAGNPLPVVRGGPGRVITPPRRSPFGGSVMVLVSTLGLLEIKCIDPMNREQLLQAIRRRLDCLPPDLGERLEEQPTGRLQLLLLAARLVHVLRELPDAYWDEDPLRC